MITNFLNYTCTVVDHNLSCVAPAEDLSDGEEVLPKEITKWNSNDLMDKIEAADTEETPGMMKALSTSSWTVTLPQYLILRMFVCVFVGELFKEMTVDYERTTSEERLDEVRVSDSECVSTRHNPNQPSLMQNHV